MAKNDNGLYDASLKYVMDKNRVVETYVRYMLVRTKSMFEYKGLPETIPASAFEYLLQTEGYCFVTEVDGELYALSGDLNGEPDPYGDPTKITVANTALNLTKQYDLKDDGVLVNGDSLRLGLLPILQKYGVMIAENTITMKTVDTVLRMVVMMSASDDRTYTGAEKFIKDIQDGKISAIGESQFFDGIKVHSVANTQNYLAQFIEYEQYLKASCFNEIGLNANYNMKRTQLGANEAALNDDFLLPLVDNMIKERQEALNKINEKYNTEISVDFASAWKVTHEENKKEIAISQATAEQVVNGKADIDISQKKGIHDINDSKIELKGSDNDECKPESGCTGSESIENEEGDPEETDSSGESENEIEAESEEPDEPEADEPSDNTEGSPENDDETFDSTEDDETDGSGSEEPGSEDPEEERKDPD